MRLQISRSMFFRAKRPRVLLQLFLLLAAFLLLALYSIKGLGSQLTPPHFLKVTDQPLCRKSDIGVDQPLMRVMVAFFPVSESNYLIQIKWCFRSLLEMLKSQPPLWRTDVILYVQNTTAKDLLELGCSTQPRKDKEEPFKCILVQYTRVKDRPVRLLLSTEYEQDLVEQLKEFPSADSIVPLAEQSEHFIQYDVVIRSDLDVFFTPAFATWVPGRCEFVSGSGGYSTSFNVQKLAAVARYNNIPFDSTIWDIGSTWVTSGPLAAKVILLYGAQLAVNEVMNAAPLNRKTLNGRRETYIYVKAKLDIQSSSTLEYEKAGVLHIHTFQDGEYFSKFRFVEGKYAGNDTLLPPSLNATQGRVCDYAAYIARQSQLISLPELGKQLRNVKSGHLLV
ncbi:hypothetical protein RvY_03328 [Ramazzottius varieornatus]|uniref:DUF7164 domain-containing protein n=1 Tax=Ramazzottius varieornatus TaxID=947166 RepID=A0A1D1UMN0_RAMVA|nr:hypothetical protein RvY_03328 [Ramazzottius varieornatus]